MSVPLPLRSGADVLASPGVPESAIDTADWRAVEDALGRDGFAVLPLLLTPARCAAIAGSFLEEERFRSRIVMERYGFGRGEYTYFRYPLPDAVERLRQSLYPRLAPSPTDGTSPCGSESAFRRRTTSSRR